MLTYVCRTIDESGEIKEIILECENESQLESIVNIQNLQLLSYKKRTRLMSNKKIGFKLKSDELLYFTQTINMLINANLSINDVMNITADTLRNRKLIDLSRQISIQLEKGDNLSDILNKLVPALPPLYLGLIRVGEKTGNLKMILKQLTTYLEREKTFRDKLTSAMIYPAFIMVLTTLFSILFILVILPEFNKMFSSLGGGLGNILEERGKILTIIIIIGLVLLVTIIALLKTRSIQIEEIILKIPFIGNIILENNSFTLVFAMAVLSESSLNIEESLIYAGDVISNRYLKLQIIKIRKEILRGTTLSSAFIDSSFPSRIASFIKVGEKTGDISCILRDLSDYYRVESNKRVDSFMTIIDPIFTMLTGSALFVIILLFILPVLTKMGDLL